MNPYKELIDTDIQGKNILLREDLNVPSKNSEIVNDERIRAAIPTINYILSKNAKVSIISHFGRPNEGKFDEKYSLRIVAEKIAKILNRSVHFEEIPLDQKSPEYTNDITVHENTRFLVGEKSGDEDLARKIAKNCDVFVMDAFAVPHIENIVQHTLSKFAPVTCGGLLIIKEIKNLKKIFENPKNP